MLLLLVIPGAGPLGSVQAAPPLALPLNLLPSAPASASSLPHPSYGASTAPSNCTSGCNSPSSTESCALREQFRDFIVP